MSLNVIAALMERREKITRKMQEARQQLHQREVDMAGVDATIRSINPAFDFDTFIPRMNVIKDEHFEPGETPVFALRVLVEATGPMTTTEVTRAMLLKRGSPQLTVRQFAILNRKVNGCLNTKVKQGVLRKRGRVQGANHAILWEVLH